MVTTRRSGAARTQSSSRSSSSRCTPDPVTRERTSCDGLESLYAFVRPTAILDDLVRAASDPEIFEQLRVALSQRPSSDQQLLERLFESSADSNSAMKDFVPCERHASPTRRSVGPQSPLTPASDLPIVDPLELDEWLSEAPNASDTSLTTEELPRGHPESATEFRLSSSPSLGVTGDRDLEAIIDLAAHSGTMFDESSSAIFQTEPPALDRSLDSSQLGLGHILDSQDLSDSRAQDLEQRYPDSPEQPPLPSLEQHPRPSPEQSPSSSPERPPSSSLEQPHPPSPEQSPNFPEPGRNSPSEQDHTDSLAQNLADPRARVPADAPAHDPTDWGSTLSTLVEERSADDVSTVPGLLTPNDSPSEVPNLAVKGPGSPDLHLLAAMSAADFAAMAFKQVERFGLPEDTQETYKDLFSQLTAVRDAGHVSDGSQLLSLANSALAERNKSTIYYALTSIELYRWHTREVLCLAGLERKAAAEQVTTNLLGLKGVTEPSTDQRKPVNTHLARGKKWARLVDEVGFGILLMRAW